MTERSESPPGAEPDRISAAIESAYRRGVSHGIVVAADLAKEAGEVDEEAAYMLACLEDASISLRYDGKPHPVYTQDLRQAARTEFDGVTNPEDL